MIKHFFNSVSSKFLIKSLKILNYNNETIWQKLKNVSHFILVQTHQHFILEPLIDI